MSKVIVLEARLDEDGGDATYSQPLARLEIDPAGIAALDDLPVLPEVVTKIIEAVARARGPAPMPPMRPYPFLPRSVACLNGKHELCLPGMPCNCECHRDDPPAPPKTP